MLWHIGSLSFLASTLCLVLAIDVSGPGTSAPRWMLDSTEDPVTPV